MTFHNFSPDFSSLAPTSPTLHLSRSATPNQIANIALGKTPLLPEERSTSFSKWCSSRRTRMNESDNLRRKSGLGVGGSSVAVRGSPVSPGALDSRRPPMGLRSPSWADGGSPNKGLAQWLSQTGAFPTDRWWLDKPDGAYDYSLRTLSESGQRVIFAQSRTRPLAPPASPFLAPPALLLEQTAHGMRRWIGLQVVRHVIVLMKHVEKDDADGLGDPPAAAAPSAAAVPSAGALFAAPAAAGGGFGGFGAAPLGAPLGASANPQQQQQAAAKAAKVKKKELMQAKARERKQQVGLLAPGCLHCCLTISCSSAAIYPCMTILCESSGRC